MFCFRGGLASSFRFESLSCYHFTRTPPEINTHSKGRFRGIRGAFSPEEWYYYRRSENTEENATDYLWKYDSPLGGITLASDGEAITGLWFDGQKHFGGAVGHNPVSLIIPCHRIVGADGSLTGYAGGIDRKRKLLEMEGIREDDANGIEEDRP